MQGRNREADVENGLVDTAGKGEGGAYLENSTDIIRPPRVKQVASGRLLRSAGSPAWRPLTAWRPRGVGWEGVYVYLWLIHVVVQLKLTQRYKSILFQLKSMLSKKLSPRAKKDIKNKE